jgi:hypothetical protein
MQQLADILSRIIPIEKKGCMAGIPHSLQGDKGPSALAIRMAPGGVE